MNAPRRLPWVARLLGGLALLPVWAAPTPEPLDVAAGRRWVDWSPDLRCAPAERRLYPTRRGVDAHLTYQFSTATPEAQLQLHLGCHIELPGDRVEVAVSWDGERFTPLGEPEPVRLDRTLDLTPHLRADRPLSVRLTLRAAGDPRQVWIERIAWSAVGVTPVMRSDDRLPPACWMAAVDTALRLRRLAPQSAPATAPADSGWRLDSPLGPGWRAGGDSFSLIPSGLARMTPGHVAQVVWQAGPTGGSLAQNGRVADAHDLPYVPLGARIEPPVGAAGWPELTVHGTSEPPTGAVLRRTGWLEIRWAAPRFEFRPDGSILAVIDAVVVNHDVDDRTGWLRLGRSTPLAAAGYRFPPGAWLATVAWRLDDATPRPVSLAVADGETVSDGLSLSLVPRRLEWVGDTAYVNGVPLTPGDGPGTYRRRPAPVTPAELAAWDSAAAPVVSVVDGDPIRRRAEWLRLAASPAVLAVLPSAARP